MVALLPVDHCPTRGHEELVFWHPPVLAAKCGKIPSARPHERLDLDFTDAADVIKLARGRHRGGAPA